MMQLDQFILNRVEAFRHHLPRGTISMPQILEKRKTADTMPEPGLDPIVQKGGQKTDDEIGTKTLDMPGHIFNQGGFLTTIEVVRRVRDWAVCGIGLRVNSEMCRRVVKDAVCRQLSLDIVIAVNES